jgi:hypothetical protein
MNLPNDIAKCDGGTCKVKDKCLRYTSKPTSRFYSVFRGDDMNKNEDGSCDMIIKNDYTRN